MFRHLMTEFHLSRDGRRPAYRPAIEALEERTLLNGDMSTGESLAPATPHADPQAFTALAGLTDIVHSLAVELGSRALKASDGIDPNAGARVHRLGRNLGKIIAVLQNQEAQIVQSQQGHADPAFEFADILFRAAVQDFQTAQRVANGAEVDALENAARLGLGAVRAKAQFNQGVQSINNFVDQARHALGQ